MATNKSRKDGRSFYGFSTIHRELGVKLFENGWMREKKRLWVKKNKKKKSGIVAKVGEKFPQSLSLSNYSSLPRWRWIDCKKLLSVRNSSKSRFSYLSFSSLTTLTLKDDDGDDGDDKSTNYRKVLTSIMNATFIHSQWYI